MKSVFGFRVIIHCQSPRVKVGEMVDIDVIFDDDFPVGFDFVGGAAFGIFDKVFDLMGTKVGLNLTKPFGEGRGFFGWVGMDEEHTAPEIDRGGDEAEAGFVDLAAKLTFFFGNGDAFTFEVVGPIVVGAGDGFLSFADGAKELGATVAAEVVEGAEASVAPHDDEEIVEARLDREVLARLADVFGKSGVAPSL